MKIERGTAYRALFDNGICKKDEVLIVIGFKSDFLGMNVFFENKKKTCPISAFKNIFEKL